MLSLVLGTLIQVHLQTPRAEQHGRPPARLPTSAAVPHAPRRCPVVEWVFWYMNAAHSASSSLLINVPRKQAYPRRR